LPALEAQLKRLENANTQACAISIDSSPVHANFGSSLGGISYPMLADFHPKGAVAKGLGVYNEENGFTDRATVIIDAGGIVRHASSVGQRDMDVVAKDCEDIDKAYSEALAPTQAAGALPTGSIVYVRNNCGASRAVLLAKNNLHLGSLEVRNVSENPAQLSELKALTKAETAPVLIAKGEVVAESAKIVSYLASTCSSL
tara:strand:+ start:3433 stop:4032 length:600 start_codon:yes stop_codon:yes gene_type:complete